MKTKHLQKGLTQLAEEGVVQVFRPLAARDYILASELPDGPVHIKYLLLVS